MKAAWYERQGPASEVLVVGEMASPEPEHRCTGASSHGDPLTDGRRIECVQWRHLRFIEAIAGVVAQQAPSHEQAQDPRSNDS